MKPQDLEGFEAAGLKPIVIDEHFDFSQLGKVFEARPVNPIDWTLLRQQKAWLYDIANGARTSDDATFSEGLISLLDHIQDNAVDTGQATELEVFGPETDE